ncbi:2-dehydropantoate 2-reductase [Listeria cornellensis]|uniref:2-dehydropantoate 2-reductase n=1 Tax=Listeria cornellensis FSL F6-0969 TaxID=1265820 RepID=W7BUU1_9LIST|nr:2-dehydropantoate 2-reductase [Listeria cornellensis]EUJ28425.1 2-dehydropantoate 2-reductase [Listeria cornellensis FSL F6-0969]
MTYRVGIIGAGALGILYAGLLRAEVTLYTRTKKQADMIEERSGIAVVVDNVESLVGVRATPIANADFTAMDFVIVTVKSYQLETVMEVLMKIPENTPLLFLQNGIGHLSQLLNLPHKTILIGTCEHGAGKMDATTVVWRGVGQTNWAIYRGKVNAMLRTAMTANPAFPFLEQADFEEMVYNKLLANAVINPLTAVLGVPNGALLHNEYWYEILVNLTGEVAYVLHCEDALEKVTAICAATSANYSSMATDVREKRRTEIASISGAVVALARKQGMVAPISETLYGLVKGLEGEYLQ